MTRLKVSKRTGTERSNMAARRARRPTKQSDLDLDNVGSPASTIDSIMAENCDLGAPRAIACIKAEVKVSGPDQQSKVTFKEGQNIVDLLTPTTSEELNLVILTQLSTGQSVDSRKVLEHIDSTCEFLDKEEPTVKEMRSGNPKAVQLLFHMEDILKGLTKIKRTWGPENKPPIWPEDVPFEDPNNGPQKKAEKLKKDGLRKMHAFLREHYLANRAIIQQQREEYMRTQPTVSRPRVESEQSLTVNQLYIRTSGMIKETVGTTDTALHVTALLENIFNRCKEGERMRLTLGDFCGDVQKEINLARLKDHMDSRDLNDKLGQVFERYHSFDNSMQPASSDTPTLCTYTANVPIPGQDTQVLPSPYQWSIPTAQQLSPHQPILQNEQPNNLQPQELVSHHQLYQDNGQHMSPQSNLVQSFTNLGFNAPMSVNHGTYDNSSEFEIKAENYIPAQPNTQMNDMQNNGDVSFMNDTEYISNVLTSSPKPNQLLGKRKLSGDGETTSFSYAEKTYTSLEPARTGKTYTTSDPSAPATELNTATPNLQEILEYINEKDLQLNNVTLEEQQRINSIIVQDTNHSAGGYTGDWGQHAMEVE